MGDPQSKTFAVMQPYFLPYIGYFQLLSAVDYFVVADNYKYTKKGWINRNQILTNGRLEKISVPLKSGPDSLEICNREISGLYDPDKILRKVRNAYGNHSDAEDLIRRALTTSEKKLDKYLLHGIRLIAKEVGIKTEILLASEFQNLRGMTGTGKIFHFGKELSCSNYINPIGGLNLYSKTDFHENGLNLSFIQTDEELIKEGTFSIVHNLYRFRSEEIAGQLNMYRLI